MITIPRPWVKVDETNAHTLEANQAFCTADLARSGLTTADLPVFVEPMKAMAFGATSTINYYVIPYFYSDGKPVLDHHGHPLMYRKRTTDPGKRYIGAQRDIAGELCTMPYFNPLRPERAHKNGVYVICEGEKKYSKLLLDEKMYGCAIGGKDMWRADDKLHPLLLEDITAAAPEQILIVPDGDWRRQDIFASYSLLILRLRERLQSVKIALADLSANRTADGERMGADDYLVAGRAWADVPVIDPEHELLLSAGDLIDRYALEFDVSKTHARSIRQNLSNTEKLLRQHPLFASLRFNEDVDNFEYGGESAAVIERVMIDLQRYCAMPKVANGSVIGALETRMAHIAYNPFADWLAGLKWDGLARFEAYAIDCLQTRRIHEEYRLEAVKRLWLQMVARTLTPGCKTDTVVIFVGRQGAHKTTHWEVFSRGSFGELPADISDKDAMMLMHTKRVIIAEELNYFRGKSAGIFKALITRVEDTYRPPYKMTVVTKVRRCVLVGNTNDAEFLLEEENRRFMPIHVHDIDLDWLKDNLEQLYAEAVHRFRAGEPWWSEDEGVWDEAKEEFAETYVHEFRVRAELQHVLDAGNTLRLANGTVALELGQLLERLTDIRPQVRSRDVASCLRRLGYTDTRMRVDGSKHPHRLWYKVKPD